MNVETRDGAVLADLRHTMAEILDVQPETITDEAHFVNDLGVDSLMALEIMVALEKKYQIKIPEQDLRRITCLNNVYEIVKEKRG
jgi:acyl carrier protein